jgi:hypothetical protein
MNPQGHAHNHAHQKQRSRIFSIKAGMKNSVPANTRHQNFLQGHELNVSKNHLKSPNKYDNGLATSNNWENYNAHDRRSEIEIHKTNNRGLNHSRERHLGQSRDHHQEADSKVVSSYKMNFEYKDPHNNGMSKPMAEFKAFLLLTKIDIEIPASLLESWSKESLENICCKINIGDNHGSTGTGKVNFRGDLVS